MSWADLLVALGLLLAIEGLLYAAFPRAMRRALLELLALPPDWLRLVGLAAAGLGVLLVWLARG